MWGTYVTVNGRQYFVFGTPDTPDSELLMKAAREAEKTEKRRRESDPYFRDYREAMRA